MSVIINTELLAQFKPCQDRWQNWLNHYKNWSGSLSRFLKLKKISTKDKLWVFGQETSGFEVIQREFAFACASRAAENCRVQEVKDYLGMTLEIYSSGNVELLDDDEYRAADRAAHRAAHSAAHSAAHWAAYRAAYSAAHSAAYSAAYWAAYRAADRAAHSAAHSAAHWAAYWAAYSAAHRAAHWAAYSAADMAAERECQLEYLKGLARGI